MMNLIVNIKQKQLHLLFIGSLIVLGLFSSCTIENIKVGDIEGFNIQEITKEHILVDIAAPVENTNSFSFTVSKANLNISVNDINLGTIEKIKPIRVRKNSNELQHFVFEFKLSQLDKESFLLIPALLSNKAKVGVKGNIKAKKFIFSKRVEVNYNKTTAIFRK